MAKRISVADGLKQKNTPISALLSPVGFAPQKDENIEETKEDKVIIKEETKEVKDTNELIDTETGEIVVQKETSPTPLDNEMFDNTIYSSVINRRKMDRDLEEKLSLIVYDASTNCQERGAIDKNNNIRKVKHIDTEINKRLFVETLSQIDTIVSVRSTSESEKKEYITKTLIDFCTMRLRFIAGIELANDLSPRQIENKMREFLDSSDMTESIKDEFISNAMEDVVNDIEKSVKRKTFQVYSLAAEAFVTYCKKKKGHNMYDILNDFIIEGLSKEPEGLECIEEARARLYENGRLENDNNIKSSKIFKKYEV